MKYLLSILLSLVICSWFVSIISSEPSLVDDFDIDEEMLFAKYQSLISATMAGKDINDVDIPPESIDELFPIMEDVADEKTPESGSITFPDQISQFYDEQIKESSNEGTISVSDEMSMEKLVETSSPQEITISDSVTEISNNEVVVDNFTTDSSFVGDMQENFNMTDAVETFTLDNYTQIQEADSANITVTHCVISPPHISSIMDDNTIHDAASKLTSYENSSRLIPAVASILSELDAIFQKNSEPSYLAGLKVVHQDEVIVVQEDLSSCKEQMEISISQQYKSEQQRDLSEIRLKKCRNDITVAKVTNEQQILAIEESKVELEFRLKEAQRENARLRAMLEDVKRNKHQDQQQQQKVCECSCAGSSSLSSQISAAVPNKISGKVDQVTNPPPSPSIPMDNGNLVNPKALGQTTTIETNTEKSTFILPVGGERAGQKSHVAHMSNNSIIPSELLIERLFRFDIPIWFRRQFSPFLLSFVAWEYRCLLGSVSFIFGLIDPRVWEKLHQILIIPISTNFDAILTQYFNFEAVSQYLGRNPAISSIISQCSSTFQRYLVIMNNSTTAVEYGHALTYYETIIETFTSDVHRVTLALVATIANSSQVKILFGQESYFFVEIAVAVCFILLTIFYRKFLLGIIVLLIFIIFFPILLLLLLLSSFVGAFMPRRRKVIKKKAQRLER